MVSEIIVNLSLSQTERPVQYGNRAASNFPSRRGSLALRSAAASLNFPRNVVLSLAATEELP